MKTLKALSLTALLLAGSMSFIQPTQASPVEATQATTATTIEAPLTTLTYDAPTVTTTQALTEDTTQPLTEATTEAPTEAPLTGPTAPLTEAPATATYTEATADPTPTAGATQAPSLDDTAGYPAQPPAPSDLATAGPEVPTAGAVCYEDEPCWNCAVMGNRICGLSEAIERSGYSPERFKAQYVGLFPHTDNPAMKRFGNRYVQSVTNPAYDYVFQMTIEESCADPATPPTWIAEWCPAPTPEN